LSIDSLSDADEQAISRRTRSTRMSAIAHPAVYEELLDLLAESADADRVLAFRLSPEKQTRLDDLLERNREGVLTDEESAELSDFERFEHVVRLLKARLLRQRGP
jgi:hypothetical protein